MQAIPQHRKVFVPWERRGEERLILRGFTGVLGSGKLEVGRGNEGWGGARWTWVGP